MTDHEPVFIDDGEHVPEDCAICDLAIHQDAKTGKLMHGFDPALEDR